MPEIDPIQNENRLTRIETKLDYLIEEHQRMIQNGQCPLTGENKGLSGKAVATIVTIASGTVVGIVEALKAVLKGQ